jgi:PAS domain-containing protein
VEKSEQVLLTADGTAVLIFKTAVPVWLGGRENLLERFLDITELEQAEDALRASEEEYRSLVESTEDSVYLVDSDCKYLFMNEKHRSRFGLPQEEVVGSPYSRFHSEAI